MSELKRTLILLVLTGLMAPALWGQHTPLLSQYMFNGLAINPAYAGSRDVLSLNAVFREQWIGLEGAPSTQTLSAHAPGKSGRNNWGFILQRDRIGVSNHNFLSGMYAYRLELNPKGLRLSMGLSGGLSLLRDRWSKIETQEQDDVLFTNDSPLFWVPSVGTGLWLDSRNFYLGLSVPYLLDFSQVTAAQYAGDRFRYRPVLLTAGTMIKLNPHLLLKPSVMVRTVQNSPVQVDVNANLGLKEVVWLGVSYRHQDALVALLEYQINPQFRLGYAYDYGLSPLNDFQSGSHEIMLRYEFGYEVRAKSPRFF